MQHHGAPTRLLDFTYSVYVAAYFALEKSKDDYAIWAIKSEWAGKESEKTSPEARSYLHPLINKETVPLFSAVFMPEAPKRFACPVNPLRLSERITIQKGVFMCPGDVTTTFEENLRALKGHDSKKNLMKLILVLDKHQRREALDDLYDLNPNVA